MNVRTNKKEGNYFSLARTAAADPRLSFKAVGLHTYLMSKGDNWQAEEADLINSHKEGRAAMRAAMQELIDYGYMTRFQLRDAAGRVVDWRVDTYESPDDNPYYQPGQPPQVVVETLAKEEDHNTTLPQSENRIVDDEPESGYPQVENRTGSNNKSLVDIDFDLSHTPAREAQSPPPAAPSATKPPQPSRPAVTVPCESPFMPKGLRLPGGYVPAGTGQNAVQVYYERFRYDDLDARLKSVQEQDLVNLCPDLVRLRQVIVEYSQAGHRPRNVKLILDWYNQSRQLVGHAAAQSNRPKGPKIINIPQAAQ